MLHLAHRFGRAKKRFSHERHLYELMSRSRLVVLVVPRSTGSDRLHIITKWLQPRRVYRYEGGAFHVV